MTAETHDAILYKQSEMQELYFLKIEKYRVLLSRGREVASRQAHNLKIVGSNPTHRNHYSIKHKI